MRVGFDVPASEATLTAALEGLTALNAVLLRRNPLPPLYESGVRYRVEQRSSSGQPEDWATAHQVMERGYGDCEDLSAWRAGELRAHGEPARAIVYRSGPRKFHAIVIRADGSKEDPSKELGMKGRS